MDNNVYVLKNYVKVKITLKDVLEKKTLVETNYVQ